MDVSKINGRRVHFRNKGVKFKKNPLYCLLLFLKTFEGVANSVDPDEMPHSAVSDLGLSYILRPV